jgi:hypothetical protein
VPLIIVRKLRKMCSVHKNLTTKFKKLDHWENDKNLGLNGSQSTFTNQTDTLEQHSHDQIDVSRQLMLCITWSTIWIIDS